MKIYYDKDIDAVYLKLSENKPTGVIEVKEGINIDTSDNDEIIGIEILNASKKFSLKTLFSCELDEDYLLNKAN